MKFSCVALPGFLLAFLLSYTTVAQSPQTPVLRYALTQATTDTSRVLLLADLSASFRYSRHDSVLYYAQQGLDLARRIHFAKGEGRCLTRLALLQSERGNLPQALRLNLQALQRNEASHDMDGIARTFNQIGLLHQSLDDHRQAFQYYFRALAIYRQIRTHDTSQLVSVLANIGATYTGAGQLDSAAYYLEKAEAEVLRETPGRWSSWGNPEPYVLRELGLLAAARHQNRDALNYYRRSAQAAMPENDLRSACRAYQYLAELYEDQQQTDSSVFYGRKALHMGQKLSYVVGIVHTSRLLADAFASRGQADSALQYLRIKQVAQDSLYNPLRLKQLDAIALAEVQRQQKLEQEQSEYQVRLYIYAMLAGLGGLLLITLLQARHNRQQRRTNAQLQELHAQVVEQKETLVAKRDELSHMLRDLKTTQNQLVMRDRMASLGELMAGVAHELQQPAQAIDNLAGISEQLSAELRGAVQALPLEKEQAEPLQDMVQSLAQYQATLRRHGQRVGNIVRGMREYSGKQPAMRQLINLNELAENYLHLIYHDALAKNPEMQVTLDLQLDEAVGEVLLVQHDIGRALINIFLNAFHALHTRTHQPDVPADYVPILTVATLRTGEEVELRVRDNGPGIPMDAQGRVFERFFSTKSPEQATGLGLALSQEIVAEGHGGTLAIESEPGAYTEVIIRLPAPQLPTVESAAATV
ncbi:tetratricopeptide repeat protein [Hymenobacter lutimineralis]|uniref:histidine kinase n=1 Tax=Hymenobacter lutimineralis TaxID=2606448 RepID=A0A5D6V7A4_9BACT|nr:ATP-binding protein [Hymenobacter lutimineralis]TYZ11881.1 tetratricopeptide repeat protein [Hymenobacter lutimineralis]